MAEQPIEPIHQFRITNLFDIGTFGGNGTPGTGTHIAFTNSALFMVLTIGLILIFLIWGSSRRAIVPGRLQLMTEMSYEFVANMVRNTAGHDGMIMHLSWSGDVLGWTGKIGKGANEYGEAHYLTITKDMKTIYVSDTNNDNLQKLVLP